MKLDRRTVLSGTAAAFAASTLSAFPARADAKRQALVDSSLDAARKILTGKDYPDAAKYIEGARGVLIVPELIQGGLIFGLAGGRGTLLARGAPKDWSPPAFYAMGSGSVGFQIGAKVSEVVFIIKTEKGLQAILDHKFKFGAEAGVSLAVVGIGVEGATTAAGGVVRYDPYCSIQYRQHEGNLVGWNIGTLARARRVKMLLQGRFKRWTDQNIHALEGIRPRMSETSRATFDAFCEARKQNLAGRVRGVWRSGVYRQTVFGSIGLMAGVMLNKV